MKRYIKLYGRLLRLNLISLLTYRVNFVNNVVASIGWGLMSLYTVIMLTAKITDAYGWKREELLLFNGIYGVVIGIFHMFLSINMGRFSRIIHMGDLDGILIKPVDSQFAVSLWMVNFSTIFRILIALGYTLWLISTMHLVITPMQIIMFGGLATGSLFMLYSLWFLILTNIIWFTNLSNLVLFMLSFESMARFPKEMLMQLTSFVLVIVFPLALVINVPARALLNRLSFPDAGFLIALSLFFGFIARKYWHFALRYYTSASS